VISTLAWPSRSETTLGWMPACKANVAWVCLKSCSPASRDRSPPSGGRIGYCPAQAYGVHGSLIAQILKAQEVAGTQGRRQRYRHYRLSKEQEEQLVGRRLDGETRTALAAEYGCTPEYVYLLVSHRTRTLSERQLEILRLVAEAYPLDRVARALGIGERTVEGHPSTICHKLGVHDRATAVERALELELI
jgi:DNA-binding CsgD family transcriptional regulator